MQTCLFNPFSSLPVLFGAGAGASVYRVLILFLWRTGLVLHHQGAKLESSHFKHDMWNMSTLLYTAVTVFLLGLQPLGGLQPLEVGPMLFTVLSSYRKQRNLKVLNKSRHFSRFLQWFSQLFVRYMSALVLMCVCLCVHLFMWSPRSKILLWAIQRIEESCEHTTTGQSSSCHVNKIDNKKNVHTVRLKNEANDKKLFILLD